MVYKGCYAKSYSVTSEWCNMSGGDALKLLNTTTIMPGEGETVGEICPRWEVSGSSGWRQPSPSSGAMGKFSTTKEFQPRGKRTTRGKVQIKKQKSTCLSRCATCKSCEKNIGTKDIWDGELTKPLRVEL